MRKIVLFLIRNRLLMNILLAAATLVVMLTTLLPADTVGKSQLFQFDKIGHFLLFFIWTLIFGLYAFSKKDTEAGLVWVLIAGFSFGVIIELLQEFTALGRRMEMGDILLDFLGTIFAVFILLFIKRNVLQATNGTTEKQY
jgi:VanZ family protein